MDTESPIGLAENSVMPGSVDEAVARQALFLMLLWKDAERDRPSGGEFGQT